MGILFNGIKPGPGVEKDEVRRKGVGLYFELLWRSLGKLVLANMLYFTISLPVLAVYFAGALYFLGIAVPEITGTASILQSALIITLLVGVLWGTGPLSAGFTYILRNTAWEEHFFTCTDFFEKSKESFKRGLAFLGIDLVMFVGSLFAIFVYYKMSVTSGGIYTVLFIVACMTLFLYTIMHFYMYEFEITFQSSFIEVYKNSLFMAIATLPMCILLTAIIYFATTLLLGLLNPVIVLLIAEFIWMCVMRFAVDFYTARTIRNKILSKYADK